MVSGSRNAELGLGPAFREQVGVLLGLADRAQVRGWVDEATKIESGLTWWFLSVCWRDAPLRALKDAFTLEAQPEAVSGISIELL